MFIVNFLSPELCRIICRKSKRGIGRIRSRCSNAKAMATHFFSACHCGSGISTPKLLATLMICFTTNLTFSATDKPDLTLKPNLGRPAPDYEGSIASPDGSGLPKGKGSVAEGKRIYTSQCAACHGEDGTLAANPLVGGVGSLASPKPLKTVGSYWPYATTLVDYIARAMPYNREKSLSPNEVYAVTAYVLRLNGIVNKDETLDASSVLKVKMPNSAGFIELHR
ncbi:MAG: cytochrome c5 [Gammaproteobacteria bacterium]|jgi:cytochrome c5